MGFFNNVTLMCVRSAPNLDALLTQLDGREVTMLDGSLVTLHTEDATVNHIDMSIIEDFLYTILLKPHGGRNYNVTKLYSGCEEEI